MARRSTSVLVAVVLVAVMVGALAIVAHAVTITEFPLPGPNRGPRGITLGPDGNLWFTENLANQIGKMTPAGSVTEFTIPTSNSGAGAITAGPDGNLWFTEERANQIGRVTTTGSFTEFTIPTYNSVAVDITSGPDGNLWFTELPKNQIGRVTTAGSFSEFIIPDVVHPFAITSGPDGNLWFTSQDSTVGRIPPADPTSMALFPIPNGGWGFGIAAGPDGNLWFTQHEYFPPKVGRISPTGAIKQFSLPTGSLPEDIAAGPDGNLWFTDFYPNRIGRMTTTGSLSLFNVPTPKGYPAGITAGPDEAIWFTESNSDKIGRIQADPGDLDTSFSGDGKVTTNFTGGDDFAWDVALQSDGKIVAAGRAAGSGGRFALARYNANGSLDTTFSGDGRVTTNFTSGDDVATSVAIQPDGKIVAAGVVAGSGGRFALARYNTDGSLDPAFSGDGKVATNFGPGLDFPWGVEIQPDGKIVAAGGATGQGGRIALARYNPDGSLDTTFSGDGKLTTNFTKLHDVAFGLAIQGDGKMVAAGSAYDGALFALVRYNADGSLDPTFSGDGKVTTNITLSDDIATGVAIQADGKIAAAGLAYNGGRFALARYNANGSLDPSFSGDGKLTTNFTRGSDLAWDLAIQSNGKLVAAGFANNGAQFALARYNTNGSLDATFSGDGKLTTNFTSGADVALGVAIQADGRIVAAGRAGGSGGRLALARYLAA